jgi:hypothetical protein
MGAPTSAILAEIFIQYFITYLDHQHFNKTSINDYFRYVEHTLIIYNTNTRNTDTFTDFNLIHPK